jgi:hypothetical protein
MSFSAPTGGPPPNSSMAAIAHSDLCDDRFIAVSTTVFQGLPAEPAQPEGHLHSSKSPMSTHTHTSMFEISDLREKMAMWTGGRWASSMPSLTTTWFLEQLVTFEPLEPFSGSVNYTMADQMRTVTILTFQSIIFEGESRLNPYR